jgi:hypothetical protein
MIAISRYAPAAVAWIGLAAHIVVGGVVAFRRPPGLSTQPLLPLLNLAVAACVLAYWARRWYGYLGRDITWYALDQTVPLYAAAVAVASGFALAGRFDGRLAHGVQWLVFGIDVLVLAAAALYMTFVRFNRLF